MVEGMRNTLVSYSLFFLCLHDYYEIISVYLLVMYLKQSGENNFAEYRASR